MSSVSSRSPSTRLKGPTMMRFMRLFAAFGVFNDAVGFGVLAHAFGRGRFGQGRERHEPGLGHVERQADRNTANFRRHMMVARRLKAGRGAGNAGETGMGAGAAAIPGALVAVADRLRRLAAEMLHQ